MGTSAISNARLSWVAISGHPLTFRTHSESKAPRRRSGRGVRLLLRMRGLREFPIVRDRIGSAVVRELGSIIRAVGFSGPSVGLGVDLGGERDGFEDLVSPEVAETLASEAGLDTAVLSPLEGLTDEQEAAGDDYLSVTRRNLEVLRDGLVCT